MIRRYGDLLLFLSHDVGRTGGRGGGSGCEEGEPMTREKREEEVWIVALIPSRDWHK